jgi:ATP-dependent protease ClpP protease subunit
MRNIFCLLTIVALALFLFSAQRSFADVELRGKETAILYLSNVISKNDADYIIQFQHDRASKDWRPAALWLNSSGGDVGAALTIGRVIRNNEWNVFGT